MLNFTLTPEQIESNWLDLMKIVNGLSHRPGVVELYEDLADRMIFAPAASRPQYHNAFPGGYVEHVLRVIDFSTSVYKEYTKLGIDTTGFTLEEIIFTALNHDLGKMGFPGDGNEYYLPQTSDWHIKNRDQYYLVNEKITHLTLADGSLFLLQHYGVKMTLNEFHCIRIHDGPLEDTNTPYFKSWKDNAKFKTSLPDIIMEADKRAMRFEYLRELKNLGTQEPAEAIDLDNIFE